MTVLTRGILSGTDVQVNWCSGVCVLCTGVQGFMCTGVSIQVVWFSGACVLTTAMLLGAGEVFRRTVGIIYISGDKVN